MFFFQLMCNQCNLYILLTELQQVTFVLLGYVYLQYYTWNNNHLTAIFQGNPDKSVSECLSSGFYWRSKDDGDGGDNWSCKTYTAPVKSSLPTYQHPCSYRPDAFPVSQPTVSNH